MKTIRIPHAPSTPLPELAEFLAPFRVHFQRSEGPQALERYLTGLLTEHPTKNCDTLAQVVPGTSEQRLQGLLTAMAWDEDDLNGQRVERLLTLTSEGDGVLIFDDTGFAKVPEEITFRTKPEIALGLLDQARAWGVRHACVVPTPTTATTPTSWPGWSGAGSGTWWPSAPTSPWRRVARLRRSGRMRGRPACRARPGEPCAGARGARAGCGAGLRRCAAGG
jgi:DDE superfamily endonuclease